MKTKRLFILVALVMLVLSSVACGGDGDEDTPPEPTAPPVAVDLVDGLEAIGDALESGCPTTTACNLNTANCLLGLSSCSEDGIILCEECYPE